MRPRRRTAARAATADLLVRRLMTSLDCCERVSRIAAYERARGVIVPGGQARRHAAPQRAQARLERRGGGWTFSTPIRPSPWRAGRHSRSATASGDWLGSSSGHCSRPGRPRQAHPWRRLLLRAFGARIGKGADVRGSARIWLPANLVMDEGAIIGPHVNCYNQAPIFLGARALVSQRASLCAGTHDPDDPAFPVDCAADPHRRGLLDRGRGVCRPRRGHRRRGRHRCARGGVRGPGTRHHLQRQPRRAEAPPPLMLHGLPN